MQLIQIDKARYRRHLNIVIAACIAGLTIGSLAIAQLLILFFPVDGGGHFHWNLLGVVVTCIIIGYLLNKYRRHAFMTEVVYIWDLKQSLNKITRKMPQLKNSANQGNLDAMLIMQYSYAGSRQLWQLDDNTILMDELSIQQAELDALTVKYSVSLETDKYNEKMLRQF